jgi:hypothetical protein
MLDREMCVRRVQQTQLNRHKNGRTTSEEQHKREQTKEQTKETRNKRILSQH